MYVTIKPKFAAPVRMLTKNTDSASQLRNMSTIASVLLYVDADLRSKMKNLKHLTLNQATKQISSLTEKALK